MTSAEPPTRLSKLRVAGYGCLGVGVVAAVLGASTLAPASGPSDDEAASSPPTSATDGQDYDESDDSPSDPPSDSPSTETTPGESRSSDPSAESDSQGQSESTGETQPTPDSPGGSDSGSPESPSRGGDSQGKGGTGSSGSGQDRGVVRILNNSKIKGLAKDAGADFRAAGYDVAEVGNFARGQIPTTTVYFRPGTSEEQPAREAATQFDLEVQPRFPGLADEPGIVVVVTNDYED